MSCNKEKLSIPLEMHNKAHSSEIFLSFRQKFKRAVIFRLLANPAETAYLSFRDRELSNDVPLVEFRRRKVVVHTFLWVAPCHSLRAGFMESHNFFVLLPILVKFHSWTRLIESSFHWRFGRGGAPKKSSTSHRFTPYANWSVANGCFHQFG